MMKVGWLTESLKKHLQTNFVFGLKYGEMDMYLLDSIRQWKEIIIIENGESNINKTNGFKD